MPTQNPTVISASLDDSELKKSIQNLVNNVTAATDKIKKTFDETVTHIRQSFDSLKDIKTDIGSNAAIAGQRQLKKSVTETAMSYDQLLGALQLAQRRMEWFQGKKFVTTEDIDKYIAAVEAAAAVQEKLNEKTREFAMLRAKQNESSWAFDAKTTIRSFDMVDERLKQLNHWYKELETQSDRQAKKDQENAAKRARALEKEKDAADKYQRKVLQDAFRGAMSMPTSSLDEMKQKLERLKPLVQTLSKNDILSESQINRANAAIAKLEEKIASINEKLASINKVNPFNNIGSYPAGKGVLVTQEKAIDEFNRKYKEAVDKAKAEQERLNQIAEMGRRSAEQSMRPRERWDVRQDSEINRLRMTIHGLELDLKQLDNTSIKQAQRQFVEYDELIKQARLEVEKLRQTPIADKNQQNTVIQQIREYENEIKRLQAEQQKIDPLSFNAERRGQITQQLQAARDEVRRLGTEMENVALIEERVARGAEQIMARQKRGKAGSAEYIDSMGQKSLITFKNEADLREKIYQIEKSAVEEKQKQLQVQKQQQQAASQYSEEIRKQAELIRQSHQFQRTGMASYSASNGQSFVILKNEEESVEQQIYRIEQRINEERERGANAQNNVTSATKATAVATEELEEKERKALIELGLIEDTSKRAFGGATNQAIRRQFSEYDNLSEAMRRVFGLQRDMIAIMNGGTNSLKGMNETLKALRQSYDSLSDADRKSARGLELRKSIQDLERSVGKLRQELSRPINLKSALGLSENTLDDIAYKMRQLASYRSGLDVNKQAGEIKQVSNELDRLRKKQDELIGTNNRLTQSNNALSRSWNYMKNRLAFYFTVGASTQFVKNLIDIRSQYEMTERSLGILINSAERGTQIFNQLSDMALVSPYTLIELSNAAKQLVAYDVAAKDVVDTTRRLADMAAAVGIPMERLTYALGQIKAYGYLNSRDARMFANAGIPLVKQLSEYYTQLEGRMVSIGDVYTRMKKKTIEYNDVMSVINKMTDEGGKFFDFQAKMAGTLKVQLANLTLAWNNMLNDIGKSNQGILATSVVALKELFLHWKDFDRVINSILRLGKIVGVIQAIRFVWLQMYKDMSAGLAMQAVAGKKVTAMLVGLRDGLVKIASSPVTWVAAIAFAFSDMYGTVQQANEAIKELNKSIRDGATESKKSLDSLLSSYDKLGTYTLTTDQKTGRVASATYTGSQDPDEMQKTWTAIREEIETSTAYGKVFVGQLVTETDLSERLSKAFEITAKLRDVHGALQDISSDSIKVGQDMSAWWNLWWADKGLIEGLKYYNEYLTAVENKDLAIFDWKSIGETAQETVDRIQKELFDKIKENADETAKSISDTFSNLKFDPQQMREGFEEISNKIFEGKGLDPKTELQGRIELEKAFISQRKQMYIDAANEQARLGNQAQAEQIRASYNTWIKGFGQSQVLVNGFYDWLKSHHASELQSMFGNMTQEEINHINWSEPKWQNWAKENAQAFSKQMGVSFDDLWRWVQDASTWRVHIGVVLDTTQIQKSVFETLSNADTKANEAYQHIKRLNDEITRLQGKSNRTKEENEKLTKAINERNVAQDDYNKAVAEGGKSAKEASDANKSAAAARKAHAAATRSQRQAESELQRSLKEELSIVDKIRSTYKDLRKAGVGTTEAIALATGGYEKSVKAINATLAKFGLERFDPSKFAGIENPHELLNMFENQLNKLIASGKAKPAEIVELETKINEMKIDVKKFDIEKITKGLNSELDKLKDEYELAVELGANPELGAALLDMFGIDESTLPKSIDKYMDKVQSEFDSYIQKMNKANSSSISLIDIFSTTDDQFKKWAEKSGFSDDYIKELTQMRNNAKGVVDKWIRDTIKSTQDLEYKLADINGKIAIEQKKLDNLRLLHQQETNEKQRHLLELMIRDQENAIDKLKQDILSTLPTYQRLFNSVVEHSARMTRQLAQNYKQMLELAVKKGKNSNGKYEVTDPISGQTAELTEKEMNAQLGKVNGKLRETQTSFDKIKEALKGGEDELVDWVKAVELIADETHKIADGISEMANIADALGVDEDVTEVINDIAASIDGLSTAAQGAAQIANGDIIGGTVNVVKGLWTTVSSWFDNSDKKITKKVKNSERAVKDLENAYKRLEYAVEHSMGAAETQARRAAIANKQLQLVELQRQLTLEKSRKKKNQDIDKIKELEGAVIDAENDLKNLKEDVMNTLLGSDIKSAAEEFVDTWVQAWREGETTLDAIAEKMDDMIFNLIKKAATSKIVGNLLQPLYDMVDQYTSASSEGGVELTTNELKALAVLSEKLGIDINNALGVFYGNLENLDIVSKNIKNNELSALQQGIQGITEDTAGALEAITNGISQQVYLHSDLLTQIRDAVVTMNGDIQLSTQSQMLLQLQNSYQVQMAIQAILIGWSNPAGSAVKVELLN